MGGGTGGMSGVVGMIAGQALNKHNNAAPSNNAQYGNGQYGNAYGPPNNNAQYGNGYGPPTNNPQYGNGQYGGYGPQANNAAPNTPCPPR